MHMEEAGSGTSCVEYHKRNLNLRVYEPDEALRGMPFCLREERKRKEGEVQGEEC